MGKATLLTLALLGCLFPRAAIAAEQEPQPPRDAPVEAPEERPGRFEAGFRMGGGAPYAFEHSDPNSVAVLSLFIGMRLGARVTRRLSLALEPGVLATPKVASTTIGIIVPPGQSPPPGVPQPLAVVSPTFGVHPFRFIEVAVGPTLAGGNLVMGGGTARLAVHIPIGAKGIRLAPAVETFALVGDRTTLATLVGTFGVEL